MKGREPHGDVKHQIQESDYLTVGKGVCDAEGVEISQGYTNTSAVLHFISSVAGLKYFITCLNEIQEDCDYEKGNCES